MNKFKKSFKYVLVFCFSLFVLVYFSSLNSYDSIWNYGFSYAISRGQIPFKEINMITPGFYNILMALGLLIYRDNITFLIEQSLLITIGFFFLYKLFNKNAWIFLLVMSFPLFLAFWPTYNYLLLILTIIIIYLEKFKKSDYLVGFLLGLCVLTKHTVGFFLLIPSIFICSGNRKKLFKRVIGFGIPCSCFLTFLIISGSFFNFFDLCILGLFDFAAKNTDFVLIYSILSILLFGISISYVVRNPHDILGYYVLAFFSVMIPIFSYYHFCVYLVMVSLLLMEKISLPSNYIRNMSIFITILVTIFNFFAMKGDKELLRANNFNYLYLDRMEKNNFFELNDLYKKYKKLGNVNILSSKNVFINVTNNNALNYFSVFLSGNFGYHGTQKMIDRVETIQNCYYILDVKEYEPALKNRRDQFAVEIAKYITENSVLVDSSSYYEIYYKE